MFQVKKVATKWACGTETVEVKKDGSKQNVLVSNCRKMFARQISQVQLAKIAKQSAQKLEGWCTTLKA